MEKPMRKVLNPNLISKREQQKVRIIVREMFEAYPFEQAMKDVQKEKKAKRVKKANALEKIKTENKSIRT